MMRYGNFSELIKDKYDNVIFEALSDFVSENPHLIESEVKGCSLKEKLAK